MSRARIEIDFTAAARVLCIGAHCDDIEIGCGGTLIRLLRDIPDVRMTWFVLTGNEQRRAETIASANRLADANNRIEIVFEDFVDGQLPYHAGGVKEAFESLKSKLAPDLVFCHWQEDGHQDHRLISEMTGNTFRDSLILEYEIPKYDGDLGRPNVYMPISEQIAKLKIDNLVQSYGSQAGKPWFDDETFRSLLRMRGIESGSNDRYAEAFHCRKMTLAS